VSQIIILIFSKITYFQRCVYIRLDRVLIREFIYQFCCLYALFEQLWMICCLSGRTTWRDKDPVIDTSLRGVVNKDNSLCVNRQVALSRMERYSHCLAAYTDGSRAPDSGLVSSAVCIPELDIQKAGRITDKLSIYTAELVAIRWALEAFLDLERRGEIAENRGVIVYSDSLSAILSIENKDSRTRPNLVVDIVQLMNKFQRRDLVIMWTPAHIGLVGNEQADVLAKTALSNSNILLNIPFEALEMNEQINKYVEDMWQVTYSASTIGTAYKKIAPMISQNIKLQGQNSRQKEVTLTRLRLGRCRLNKYLFQIKKHADGLCATCNVPETIEHYLMECSESEIGDELRVRCINKNIDFNLINILNNPELLELAYGNINRKI
jgi:ribonuclease HI